MATIIRTDFEGAVHHVFARGNNKQAIFLDNGDRQSFLRRLSGLKAETQFRLYAYCLMTNHFHLVIETARVSLAAVMGRLQSGYAAYFNNKHGRVGHLFQGPYGAKLCGRDAYLLRLVRYVHRNPVAAGMVSSPSDWAWSGHRQLSSGGAGLLDEELPLGFFHSDRARARESYDAFAHDPEDDGCRNFDEDSVPIPGRELLDLARQVCDEAGISLEALIAGGKARHLTPVKTEIVRRSRVEGYTQAAVAGLLGCTKSALSRLVTRNVNKSGLPAS